jgi:hypothetical protein
MESHRVVIRCFWGPLMFIVEQYWGHLPQDKVSCVWIWTYHLLMPTLRLSGAVPPLPWYAFLTCTKTTVPFTLNHLLLEVSVRRYHTEYRHVICVAISDPRLVSPGSVNRKSCRFWKQIVLQGHESWSPLNVNCVILNWVMRSNVTKVQTKCFSVKSK